MLIKQKLLDNGWGPGGWTFTQPETDWTAPNPMGTTFAQQVENIRKHRAANPRFPFSLEPVVIAQELEEYTLARWRRTYSERGMQKFLENPDDSLKKKSSAASITSQRPQSLLGKAAGLAGIDSAVLEDWFGAGGKPVDPALALGRAAVCTAGANGCPGNRKGNWRDVLTMATAKTLRAYFGAKHDMQLSTPLDKDLGLCKGCGCVLELKVWAPGFWVIKNLDDDQKLKLHDLNSKCWILSEAANV
jgi:hypothetical protein